MPKLMAPAVQDAFAARLASYVAEAGLERCLVALHGGEPLLLGPERIVRFANGVRNEIGDRCSVDVAMQTNGVLVTESALGMFADANIGVSLSLDGPRDVHDRHRARRGGGGSFDAVFSALRALQTRPEIFTGVIAVIDPQVEPSTLFEFFDQSGVLKLDLLLPDAHHLRPPVGRKANPDLYVDWLIRAFDLWLDRFPHISVRTFEAVLDAVAGLPSRTDAFGFGDVSLLTVETDGSYHGLDVLKIVSNTATKLHGDVFDTTIQAVAASAEVARHRQMLRLDGLCETCRACDEVKVCGGGAVPHRFGVNQYQHPTIYCREMLALIRHVRRRLKDQLVPAPAVVDAIQAIDLEQFELAESGGAIVHGLVQAARAEHARAFQRLLDDIRESDPASAVIASELLSLTPERLALVASHPGAVAWQLARTRRSVAVDGTPLDRSTSYLAFLATMSTKERTRLTVGAEDPWLRLPFGSSVQFEPSEVLGWALPLFEEAMGVIRSWRPRLADEIETASAAVQFISDPTAEPDKIVSFSDNSVPGALFVSIRQGERPIDPYDLADSLIHEHRHQKLYLLERVTPLVLPSDMRVPSPWREDLRPPSGLLHALFVFVELRRLWLHIRERGPDRLRVRATCHITETDDRLARGFATLASCPLTEHGRRLAAHLEVCSRQPSAQGEQGD